MRYIAVIFLILIISGCATSSDAPKFSEVKAPIIKNDSAILYIFRDHAEPTAFSSYLEVDQKEVASLNQKGFTWVYVAQGEHELKFAWPFLASMPDVDFKYTFEAGKVYAFEMSGAVTMGGSTINARSAIQPTNIETAKQHMKACCRYVPPKDTE